MGTPGVLIPKVPKDFSKKPFLREKTFQTIFQYAFSQIKETGPITGSRSHRLLITLITCDLDA